MEVPPRLKAAPPLRTCVSMNTLPITCTYVCSGMFATTRILETRSAAITTTATPSSRPTRRCRSAAFLPLFARHAQAGPRERHQARLPDRLTAGFAYSICSRIDPVQGALTLIEQVLRVLGQGKVVLALEGLGPGVGRVVARVPDGIGEAFGDVSGDPGDIGAQACHLGLELGPHLLGLGVGPGLFARAARKISRGVGSAGDDPPEPPRAFGGIRPRYCGHAASRSRKVMRSTEDKPRCYARQTGRQLLLG